MNAPRKEPVNMTTNRTGKLNVGLFDQNRQNGNRTAQEANVAMPSGEVDSLPVQEQQPQQTQFKEDFPDPFAIQSEMIANSRAAAASMVNKKDKGEESVEQLNKALGGNDNKGIDDEILKISKSDMLIAEQLIFQGYAEIEIEMANFPGRKFTICSTNAEEYSIIDTIVFDVIRKAKQLPDGSVEMPENEIRALRNALFISISYRGVDGKDLSSDPISHINTIKRAILKLGDLNNSGDIVKAEELKSSIMKALLKRATIVKRMPTSLIDWITSKKYDFDAKMLKIMGQEQIVSLY